MSHRIALLGLSGVGKTTLIASVREATPLLHLQASTLIKAEQVHRAQEPASSEALRVGPVLSNQELLIAAFRREAAAAEHPIIFDGHSIIDGQDGIVEIPSEVFLALDLNAIFFLSAHPKVIAQRRLLDTTRQRPERDAETLASHQNIAKKAAQRIAVDIQRPFFDINDGGVSQIIKFISG